MSTELFQDVQRTILGCPWKASDHPKVSLESCPNTPGKTPEFLEYLQLENWLKVVKHHTNKQVNESLRQKANVETCVTLPREVTQTRAVRGQHAGFFHACQ